jgi:hypothetical protein
MQIQVLFDTKGQVHATFHPSTEANAPTLEFHPARAQRTALLEVPPELEGLAPREFHAAAAVRLRKDEPRLVKR